MTTRCCSACGVEKPLSLFPVSKLGRDGTKHACPRDEFFSDDGSLMIGTSYDIL